MKLTIWIKLNITVDIPIAISIRPKKILPGKSRCYRISEHQKEKKDINVLVRLHMELKQIRNQANHAGEDDNRYSIDTVRKALKAYVELYEKIERKLHR